MFLDSFFLLLSLEPFSWSEGARVRRLIAYFLFENKLALRKKFHSRVFTGKVWAIDFFQYSWNGSVKCIDSINCCFTRQTIALPVFFACVWWMNSLCVLLAVQYTNWEIVLLLPQCSLFPALSSCMLLSFGRNGSTCKGNKHFQHYSWELGNRNSYVVMEVFQWSIAHSKLAFSCQGALRNRCLKI